MERLKVLFRQTEFQVLLFSLCLVVFGWPVVSFSDIERLQNMFVYLFVVWGVIIFLLFLVAKSIPAPDVSQEDESGKK
jgi:hypothetical protein